MTISYTTYQDSYETTNDDLVLLVFSSTWCEPCKRMHSVLEEIDCEMSGVVKIVINDLNENQDFANNFDLIGTPTLILLRGDKILEKMMGYQPKEIVIELIHRHLV